MPRVSRIHLYQTQRFLSVSVNDDIYGIDGEHIPLFLATWYGAVGHAAREGFARRAAAAGSVAGSTVRTGRDRPQRGARADVAGEDPLLEGTTFLMHVSLRRAKLR